MPSELPRASWASGAGADFAGRDGLRGLPAGNDEPARPALSLSVH